MSAVANKRLANRVIWSLEDITASSARALLFVDKATHRAELKCADPALLLALSEIRVDLMEIKLLACTARQGEYAGTQH